MSQIATPTYPNGSPTMTSVGGIYCAGPIRIQTGLTAAAGDNYPSGGYTVSAGGWAGGLTKVLGVVQIGNNTAATGYHVEWNTTTSKLQVLVAANTEASGDIHTLTFDILVYGF